MSKSKKIFNSSISIILCLLMTCSIFAGSIIPASASNLIENDSNFATNTDNCPISSEEILNALNNAEIVYTSEDSKFVLADSSVEISDDYFPNTADIYEAQHAYDEQIADEGIASVSENEQDYVGDPMVYYTQKWLNQEYGNVPGFGSVPENGKTGWATVNGLLRALQHELGITNLADNFGPTTSSLYAQNILRRQDGVTDRKFAILQGALWCKGYCPGYNYSYSNGTVSINAVFDETVENAVKQLQKDAGLATQDGIVSLNIMKALMSMDSFKLLPTSYGSDANIRAFQQWMNQKYETYTGLNPCDGVFGRNTNKALIYALQAEEGMPTTVANGNFGNTTLLCCPDIPYNINDTNATRSYPGNSAGSLYSYSNVTSFTKLAQFALYVNGFGNGNFNGIFDNATRQAVRQFQEHHVININGNVTKGTWLSLFISCGDRSRNASAADCATILTQQKAEALYNNGYRYIGRYLTGTYGGGINKALSRDEAEIILNAGLNFFPIFEEGGWQESYFTAAQGTIDAKKAINKAKEIGIPEGTIIYFAVDFDAMDYQITQRIIPYFQKVHEEMSCDIYKTGIYGARNVCSKVSEQGYACASFVGNMSTGFSGNLGYKMPSNWTFDQFTDKDSNGNYLTILSSDGSFNIDKDAVSERDLGVSELSELNTFISDSITIDQGSSSDVLTGPYINLFGYEIPLFEINIALSSFTTDSLVINYNNDTKLLEVQFGVKTDTTDPKIKTKDYAEIKSFINHFNQNTTTATWNNYQKIKSRLKKCNVDFGFNFDSYVLGYATIYCGNSQPTLTEGGIIYMSEVTTSLTIPTQIPLLGIKFELRGGFNGKFGLEMAQPSVFKLNFSPSFSVEPRVGFLVGTEGVANVYAGLSAQLNCEFSSLDTDISSSFQAILNGKLFLDVEVLNFSRSFEWEYYNKVLYPLSDRNEIYSVLSSDLEPIQPIENNEDISTCMLTSTFRNNMQLYAKPQIANIGNGKLFMCYIDDDSFQTSENRFTLMYSIYDDGEWSAPQKVLDDGTADFEPIICADANGGVHIIWQNASSYFLPNVSLEQMSSSMELYYTHWNGTSFDNSTSITSNNQNIEFAHKIATNGDDISIIWQQNSANDILNMNGTNSIYRKQFQNNSWLQAEQIACDYSNIVSIDTSYVNNNNLIVFSAKTTNTFSLTDTELFLYNNNSLEQLTFNDSPDHSVILDGDNIYWIRNNFLMCRKINDENFSETLICKFNYTPSKVKLIESENGKRSIVWEEESMAGMTFLVSNYDPNTEKFGSAYPISSDTGVIRGWDACFDTAENIQLSFCYADFSESSDNEWYDTLCLIQKEAEPFCDIYVNPIITYQDEILPEQNITLQTELSNYGSLAVTQFNVIITDSNDNVIQTSTINHSLDIGETNDINIPFTLPASIIKSDYSISIQPSNAPDVCVSNNYGHFTIGYDDLSIESVEETRTNSSHTLSVAIKNLGYNTVENFSINAYCDSVNGNLIALESIESLTPNGVRTISIPLDTSFSPSNLSNPRLLCLTLNSNVEENNYVNNYYNYCIYPDYHVTVQAGTTGGTVLGTGTYEKGEIVQISASPTDGYMFQGWYENNIRIADAGSSYSFDAVCDRNLEARFVELESCSIEAIEGTAAVVDNQNKYLRGIIPFSNFEDYFAITNGGSICKIYNNNYSTYNATGVIVQLLSSNGTVVDIYHIVIAGDINGDGAIDAFDVIMLDFYLHTTIEIDDVFLAACDMNLDGEVDTTDYTLLRNYVMCV